MSSKLSEAWILYEMAEKIHDKHMLMSLVVKETMLYGSSTENINRALAECAKRPILFEPGMTIAMLASEYVRDLFRRRLVECGAILQAMRLVRFMDAPLSRNEIVMLGNRHFGKLLREEVLLFLLHAEKTTGVTSLDLHRLRKQLEIRMI